MARDATNAFSPASAIVVMCPPKATHTASASLNGMRPVPPGENEYSQPFAGLVTQTREGGGIKPQAGAEMN